MKKDQYAGSGPTIGGFLMETKKIKVWWGDGKKNKFFKANNWVGYGEKCSFEDQTRALAGD